MKYLIFIFFIFLIGCQDEVIKDNDIENDEIIEESEKDEDTKEEPEKDTKEEPEKGKDINCEKIIESWQSIKGYDYVWGGNRFRDGGFDCSGAIWKVSKLIGKPIPRTTSKKYFLSTDSEELHWSEGKCGYIVWWTLQSDRPYGHLGMHTIQPKFWHSGSSSGPTEATHWQGGFWDQHFEATKKFYK